MKASCKNSNNVYVCVFFPHTHFSSTLFMLARRDVISFPLFWLCIRRPVTDEKLLNVQEALTAHVVSWYVLFSLSLPCFVCCVLTLVKNNIEIMFMRQKYHCTSLSCDLKRIQFVFSSYKGSRSFDLQIQWKTPRCRARSFNSVLISFTLFTCSQQCCEPFSLLKCWCIECARISERAWAELQVKLLRKQYDAL